MSVVDVFGLIQAFALMILLSQFCILHMCMKLCNIGYHRRKHLVINHGRKTSVCDVNVMYLQGCNLCFSASQVKLLDDTSW